MNCPKCGSENVSVQVTQDLKIKKKGHGIFYWLFFGWLIDLFLWLFLTVPMLIIAIFKPRKSKVTAKERSVAVCQNCGYRWNLK